MTRSTAPRGEKYDAIIKLIEECRAAQPAGAGRHRQIEKSEMLSRLLKKKIPHQVLNARHHEREARSSRRPACPAR